MQFLGLSPDDYTEENTAHVWPCNVQAVNLFIEVGTQWRVGPSGPYGLDYNIVYDEIYRIGLGAEAVQQMKADIRILEDAALEELRRE